MGAYWPDAVTEPQHLWPFFQTGDYSDQGATGGLTLTAQGSGNSFGAGGLVLNGSGWADVAANADLYDLGDTFSIIIDVSTTSTGNIYIGACDNWYTSGYLLQCNNLVLTFRSLHDGGEDTIEYDTLSSGVLAQIVLTYTGGRLYAYMDGSPVSNWACHIPTYASAGFAVGTYTYGGGGFYFVGTIKRIGILKGTAWSSDDVAAIYAWAPGTASLNATATESSSVLESIAASVTAAVLLTVGVSDAATVTEAVNTAVAEQPTLTIDLADQTGVLESIAAATSLAETLGVNIQEAIAAYEAANTTVAEQVILNASSVDTAGVSEAVAGIVPSITACDVSTADTATATTTATVSVTQLPCSVTAADAVTINEQTTAIVTLEEYATATDEIGVIDLANVNVAFIGDLIEVPIYQAESDYYRYVGMVRLP